MKHAPKKLENVRQEEIVEQLKKILEKRGGKALEMARKAILEEKIECKEVREALHYFITEYSHDVARPALLSLACEAVGGDPEVTTPIAICMILISGGIDIHDDIIDQSKRKRNQLTVLGKFGKENALLVGDALLLKGLILLNKVNEKIKKERLADIFNVLKSLFFELGDAEAMELRFRGRFDVSPNEYLAIVRKKAADVEAHTRISAILGNGRRREIESLSNYGRILGTLIILGDDNADVLNPEELLHRLKKEHLPLPVLYALQDSKAKRRLMKIFKKKTLTKNDAEKIFNITFEVGGFNRIEELMEKLIQDGIAELKNIRNCRSELELLIKSTYPK